MTLDRVRFSLQNALLTLALVLPFCALLSSPASAQSQTERQSPATQNAAQESFASPEAAADAMIQAAEQNDTAALLKIFGPEGKEFVSSADPVQDKNYLAAFVGKTREKKSVTIDPKNSSKAVLSLGNDDWPFPVPIVKHGTKWIFDSKQGRDEILYRRIGANELDAIKICEGFVEAQEEYASEIRDDSGINQYAQRIISTPGKHDGLYWENPDGTPGGPISRAIARAIEEGYSPDQPSGYHGYIFKVLKGQGPAARLGQLDYVINGIMIGGFALVAVPAEYRVTGVKTFMVSYDGIVYEQDLGPESRKVVSTMESYNPDKTWHRVSDSWIRDIDSEAE
ncbi:MAG TPA: DUF2950 domain-containing protein [Candidatus Sulfotelmatobacter sp.]|nr:DUF2950 domain-containing protein [Candidatus Sulfotelmatobacter sp.]